MRLRKDEQGIPAFVYSENGYAPRLVLFPPDILLLATNHSYILDKCLILVPESPKILALQINNLNLREGGFDGVKRQNSFISRVKSRIINMAKILHVANISYPILLIHPCINGRKEIVLLTPFLYRHFCFAMLRST